MDNNDAIEAIMTLMDSDEILEMGYSDKALLLDGRPYSTMTMTFADGNEFLIAVKKIKDGS